MSDAVSKLAEEIHRGYDKDMPVTGVSHSEDMREWVEERVRDFLAPLDAGAAEIVAAADELCFGPGEIEVDPLARLEKACRARRDALEGGTEAAS